MQTGVALDLVVNGGPVQAPDGVTVAGLLDRLGLDLRKVAVERNEEIVVRSSYETLRLESGDRLEIVHFIGGG
jgi:thiamine biosynthesis protein ThiS